ncbi:triose-phosphate isomerase [Buchnera aphidicola]|uniref:triose-phosphate isomerase n=1 Tax=Buchnera aphidicola TaxID=9 RepID=UPI0031B816E7
MKKSFIIIANWKLNGNNKSIKKFLKLLDSFLFIKAYSCKVIFFPPLIYLNHASKIITYNNLFIGSQNVDNHSFGAYTGEISSYMLKDIGIKYVIIGHSERRIYHKENNKIIAEKFKLLKKIGLIPILCIGENYNQKKKKQTKKIIIKQIDEIYNLCGNLSFDNTIIAYEPIWSIGTGKIANAKNIQKIHNFIKKYIQYKNEKKKIKKLKLLYGGSVNETNIQDFLKEKDIDGVLVGGASLDFYQFTTLLTLSNNLSF